MPSLALRVIGLASLALGLMLATLFVAWQSERVADLGPNAMRFPFPDQIAAIVDLLEDSPADARPLILRALNNPQLRVSLQTSPPNNLGTERDLPGVAWTIARYLNALGERRVQVRLARAGADDPYGRLLQVAVLLRSGEWALIEIRGALLRSLSGRPLASLVAVLLLLIGATALWSLRRQFRPLEDLIAAVESYGTSVERDPPPARGAPEVKRLLTAFERLRARIHALLSHRTRLFAAISHDLGTYLTRLRLRLDELPDADQRRRAAADIESMQRLLGDTLMLARSEDRSTRDRFTTIDLAALLRRTADAYAGSSMPVRLIHVDAASVYGSADALERLLGNLISNALKYGAQADLSLLSANGQVVLQVEDRGPGIPTADRDVVLEPFWRGDAARNLDCDGSGLGLTIVADIVRRHGGILQLQDRHGGGLSARVVLPSAPT